MIERDELGKIKKIVAGKGSINPMDLIYEEERMEESRRLRQTMESLLKRFEDMETYTSPKRERIKFREPYQYVTVPDGGVARVYWQGVPSGWVAVILKMANSWHANTYYEVNVDEVLRERRLERSMAALNNPIMVKQFAKKHILWTGFNNSGQDRTMEVLVDGYFIREEIHERIEKVETEVD